MLESIHIDIFISNDPQFGRKEGGAKHVQANSLPDKRVGIDGTHIGRIDKQTYGIALRFSCKERVNNGHRLVHRRGDIPANDTIAGLPRVKLFVPLVVVDIEVD